MYDNSHPEVMKAHQAAQQRVAGILGRYSESPIGQFLTAMAGMRDGVMPGGVWKESMPRNFR